jgi:hypothetical protein
MPVGLSIAALVVTLIGVVATAQAKTEAAHSAQAAVRSADAAETADRRERTPQLAVELNQPNPVPGELAIYRVPSDGPQDPDDIIIYRPRPSDRITYKIAGAGDFGFADNESHLGSLALTQEAWFTLGCGVVAKLPDSRVRIQCHAGDESWMSARLLPPPR